MSAKKNKAPTDFNDIWLMKGAAEVRAQIMPVVDRLRAGQAANDAQPDQLVPDQEPPFDYADYPEQQGEPIDQSDISPDPSKAAVAVPAFTIDKVLQRFIFTTPNGKIWDAHKRQLMKSTPFKNLVGLKLFNEWNNHEKRKVQDEDTLTQKQSGGDGNRSLDRALKRYVYLYPETSFWDTLKRKVVSATGLKVALADCYDDFVKDPARREIDIENLVFDPKCSVDPDTHINMFRGLAVEPADTAKGCGAIGDLLLFLCNNDRHVYQWLMKWLAYPLQNMGSKMASAVMMHSEVQGSGKSLFFDKVMRGIYGEYSATLGQHQLESQYTDWRSQLLYGVFEEIFSRDQKYNHTGTIKQMITGETMRIEKKFVSGWEEANYMNGVFLSNEIQPFPLDPTDRRMLVIWPEGKLSNDLRDRVLAEIDNGGIQAFYRWLLDIDLTGFHTHFEPPMTAAKERLIDFGRSGWDAFYREWQQGLLGVNGKPIPYCSCLIKDLYTLYKIWCRDTNEKVLSLKAFSSFVSVPSRGRRKPDCRYKYGSVDGKATILQVVPKEANDDTPQDKWLGEQVERFKKGLESLQGQDNV